LQFIDLTERVLECVRRSGVSNGMVNLQTRHTTTALLVNENEPLLLEDMKQRLQALAPRGLDYRHDDLEKRANVPAGEPRNGHAHCKALFLRTSETLNIVNGCVQLGAWQRVFLVELDRARPRAVSVMVLGTGHHPAG